MTDPTTGAVGGALVKMATEASADAVRTTNGLLARALGPSFDVLGQYWAERMSSYTEANRRRLAEKALRKLHGRQGVVHPRVAYKVLEDGSLCDDELMAEYFSGILASAKVPNGRDDAGVSWSTLVSGMSSLQIRAHFLLYREWARLLHGSSLNLGIESGRRQAILYVDYTEFVPFLSDVTPTDPTVHVLYGSRHVDHAIPGLQRVGLITQYAYGHVKQDPILRDSPHDAALAVIPSPAGMELYGWAQGSGGLSALDFSTGAIDFDTEPPTPQLKTAVLHS